MLKCEYHSDTKTVGISNLNQYNVGNSKKKKKVGKVACLVNPEMN